MKKDPHALRNAQGTFDEILPSRIREVRNGFARALSDALARAEISYGEWRCLRVLWDADGITQPELSERLDMTSAATVFAVNLLERDGIARRDPDPLDRRRIFVRLTPRGHALRKTLLAESRRIHARIFQPLSDAEILQLSELVEKLQAGLAEEIGRMKRAQATRRRKESAKKA